MKLIIAKKNMAETVLVLLLIITVMFNDYQYGTLLSHVIYFVLIFIFVMLTKKWIVKNSLPFLIYGFIWCVFFALGTLAAQNTPYVGGISNIIHISILIIFTCLFMGLKFEKRRLETILFVYTLCNVFVSMNIIFNYLTGKYYMDQRASFLINDVYKDPNYVSSLIVPAIFLAFFQLRNTNLFLSKIFFLTIFGIMLVAILISGSRAAFIGILISAVLYIVLQLLNRRIKLIYKIGILLLAIIVMFIGSYILMASSESRFTDVSGYMNDIRIVIWTDALSFWTKSPIIGNGVNASSNYTLTCWYGRATHNCFLDLLGDSGIIGIVCMFGIICQIIRKLQDKQVAIAFIAICLVPQAFINGFYGFNFWFVICLIKLVVDYSAFVEESKFEIGSI